MNEEQSSSAEEERRKRREGGKMGFAEFVALTAAMLSLVALSIDAMLPALPDIGRDLATSSPNDVQLVITVMLFGFGIGQLIYGPISDSTGRKPPIYVGIAIYLIGCVICIFAQSLTVMLVGRFLQGFGVAAPRILTAAIVRDHFEGRAMARVMSFVMAVFIVVLAIAPAIGQGILFVADWRAIFGTFLVIAVVVLIWLGTRLAETVTPERRAPLSFRRNARAIAEVFRTRQAFGYTLATGFIFSPFLGYLSSAQQIFADVYDMKAEFPIYFAVLALSLGVSSLVNARLVMKLGMRRLSAWSAVIFTALSIAMSAGLFTVTNQPPFWVFMAYFMVTFFCVGILFGNMNALAMEPLGHIAGVGAAVVGAISAMMSVAAGIVIGQAFDGTIVPLVLGFAVFGVAVLVTMWITEKGG